MYFHYKLAPAHCRTVHLTPDDCKPPIADPHRDDFVGDVDIDTEYLYALRRQSPIYFDPLIAAGHLRETICHGEAVVAFYVATNRYAVERLVNAHSMTLNVSSDGEWFTIEGVTTTDSEWVEQLRQHLVGIAGTTYHVLNKHGRW